MMEPRQDNNHTRAIDRHVLFPDLRARERKERGRDKHEQRRQEFWAQLHVANGDTGQNQKERTKDKRPLPAT
jgi:hypothetical protein